MCKGIRAPTIIVVVLVAWTASASAEYGWQTPAPTLDPTSPTNVCMFVSASASTAYETMTTPWQGERSLYLWTTGCISPATGSEFSLFGTLEMVDTIPRNGTVNLGTATSPILRYEDCVFDMMVAEIVVRDAQGAGGHLCLGPSDQNGINGSMKCVPEYEPHVWSGLSSDGDPPCSGGPVSVAPQTWGSTKARYR